MAEASGDVAKADEMMRQRAVLMRIAGRMTNTGGWVLDLSNNDMFWTDEVFSILEFPPGRVPDFTELMALYADPLATPAAMEACVRDGIPFDLEVEILTAKRRRIWVRVCGEAERDDRGTIRQVRGALQDITGRKLHEESSARQRNEFRTLFDLMPAMIWFKDMENGILRVNQRVADAAGIPIEEIEGKPSAAIYPEDAASYHADDLEVIHSGIPKLAYVEMVRSPDGKEIWVQSDKLPVRDSEGNIMGIVVMSRDVTEWKRAELALHDSEEKFRLLADNLTDAFWIRSPDMRTLHYLSPGYERIWGRPVADMESNPHTWIDAIVPDDRERVRAVFDSLTGGTPRISVEYRIVRPDGEIRWIHARGFQVRDAAGTLLRLTGIVTDITGRRLAEEIRREQAALLDNAQRIGRMGSWCMHIRAGRLVWSDATCELFGIAPGDFAGTFEDFQSLILAEDLPVYSAMLDSLTPSNTTWEAEYRIRWHDGQVRSMYERGDAEFDSAGDCINRIGMVMDVTERKVSEDKLRQSLTLLRIAGNMAGVGGWSMKVSDHQVQWSEEVSNLLGLPAGNLLPLEEVLNLYLPDSKDKMAAALTLCESDGTEFDLDLELKDVTGQELWVRVCGEAARDAAGKIIGIHGAFSDISERKRANETMRRSEGRLRLVLDGLGPHMFAGLMDLEGKMLMANRTAVASAGLRDEDITGLLLEDTYWWAYSEAARERIRAAVRRAGSGETVRFDDRIRVAGGELIWIDFSLHPVCDAAGGVAFLVPSAIVITERKRAEDSLLLLNSAVEQSKESILITDTALDLPGPAILFVNQAFTTMTGYTAEEAIGKTPRILQGPLTDRAVMARLRRNLESGEKFEGESVNYRKDGTAFHLEWQISPLRDADGIATHYVAIQRDVTARKEAEEELRWKTALLEAQVDSYGVGILVVDGNGRKILQNGRMVELWQIPPEIAASDDDSAQVRFVLRRTARPERFIEKVNYLYAHPDESSTDEVELIDGTFLERYSAPVIGKDGRHYGRIWTFADITVRKRAESDRAALNQRLVEVSRQAGMAEVATNVLHNVGNVLNSVNISCSVIEDKVRNSRVGSVAKTAELLQSHAADMAAFFTTDAAGKKLPEYLGKLAVRLAEEQAAISAELRLLSGNIDHIKDIVAMQQNFSRVSGVTEIIVIAGLIDEALRMSGEALRRHNIKVLREYGDVPPALMEKAKVLQILMNLISNAKSACADSGRADKQIMVRLTAADDVARIAVIDNGVGISPENLTRIFAHGFTTKSDGHGFGLHSSVLAAREIGGDLTVQSQGPGQGATFTLELPLAAAPTK